MTVRRRPGNVAIDLWVSNIRCQGGKWLWRQITGLPLQTIPSNGAPIQAWRCARFQPTQRQTHIIQTLGQAEGWRFPDPTGGPIIFTYVYAATQESSRGDNHTAAGIFASVL